MVETTRKELEDRHLGIGFSPSSVQVRAIAIAQDLARTRGEQEPSQDSWSAAWKQALCELEPKLDALGSAFKSTLVRGRCLRHRLRHCDICRDDARSATRKSTGPRSCSAASVVPSVSGGAAPLSLRLCADDCSVEAVPCAPTDTVQTLIDKYVRQKGVDPARLRLLEDNIRLNTGMTIASCGLRDGQRIEVFTEIEGGGARPPSSALSLHAQPRPSVARLRPLLAPWHSPTPLTAWGSRSARFQFLSRHPRPTRSGQQPPR